MYRYCPAGHFRRMSSLVIFLRIPGIPVLFGSFVSARVALILHVLFESLLAPLLRSLQDVFHFLFLRRVGSPQHRTEVVEMIILFVAELVVYDEGC